MSDSSPTWGGGGGQPFSNICPNGTYVTKFIGRAGDRIDHLAVQCSDGTYLSAGGQGGNNWDMGACSDGITKFTAQSGTRLDAFYGVNCGDNDTGGRHGGGGGDLRKYTCPYPMVATGFTGRSNKEIDNISIQCSNLCAHSSGNYLSWPKCKEWCKNAGKGQCESALQAYCNNNSISDELCRPYVCAKEDGSFLNREECRDWCKKNPGVCDRATINWCSKNKGNKSYCGCYNIEIPDTTDDKLKDLFKTPQCYVDQCKGNVEAYMTKEWNETKNCPANVICLASINQVAGGAASMKNVTIDQHCGEDKAKPGETIVDDNSPTNLDNPDDTTTSATPANNTFKYYMAGGGGVFICFCMIIILILLVMAM